MAIPSAKQNYSWMSPAGVSSRGNNLATRTNARQSATFNLDNVFGALLKAEEIGNKTDQILPFPLDKTGESLAAAAAAIIQSKEQLLQAYRSGIITKSEKASIKRMILKCKKIKQAIQKVYVELGKMKI